MKFNYFFPFLLCFAFQFASAQTNLVPNPGFEQYSQCPDGLGQPDRATGWDSFRESPDFMNACALQSSLVSVPSNCMGYQYPAGGNGYCAFQTYFTSEFREIIGCALTAPLTIGQKYYVKFKVVRAHGGTAGASCGSNNIGLLFTTNGYSYFNPISINNFAHIYTNSIVTDTLNWIAISGSIIADSAYQYIGIGNFFTDANTDTAWFGGPGCRAIYYADDVCVSTDSLYCASFTTSIDEERSRKAFSIYPNPVREIMQVQSEDAIHTIRIVNSLGQIVMETNVGANSTTIQVDGLSEGIYIINLSTTGGYFQRKFIILK
jgi:hypothetical protein